MPNMTQTSALTAALTASLALAASATANVTEIGEFTGDVFEGFEAIGPPAPWDGPMPIFGGAATFDDEFTDPWIATSLSGGDNVTVLPYDGNLMGLAPTGWSRFNFSTPIVQFGGFFATTMQAAGGRANFYGEDGELIESFDLEVSVGEWGWHGWESSEPIFSIELHTAKNPGTTTVYDNLQMTFLPAPGALTVLAFAAAGTRRRRC